MAGTQPFRTALNGFHREDVVNYIEYLNNRHNSQMEQMHSQLLAAQDALKKASAAKNDDLQAKLEEALAKCDQLEKELAAANQAKSELDKQSELEAYRRAERAERMAQERAAQIYTQANAVLADATLKVDSAIEQISAQLQQVQDTVGNSKALLQDAATAMYAIRPEE